MIKRHSSSREYDVLNFGTQQDAVSIPVQTFQSAATSDISSQKLLLNTCAESITGLTAIPTGYFDVQV